MLKYRECKECGKGATYNYPNQTERLYCSAHQLPGMISLSAKYCIENCGIRASFNSPGENTRLYCNIHKKEGMVKMGAQECLDCTKRPSYNLPTEKKPLYCATHKKEGMIDVASCKRCNIKDCFEPAKYNLPGQPSILCKEHKTPEMVNRRELMCQEPGCELHANYNIVGDKTPLYCENHCKDGMVNIKSKKCITPLCGTVVHNPKYLGHCLFCYVNMFPDQPVARGYRLKEKDVVNHIKEKFPDFTWITDRKISGGCSNRRPDLFLDLGYQIIIVEIDENQHTDYDCSCENRRIMELSQDVGHRPIIFIRFNPDEYIERDGKKVLSPWAINGYGVSNVKKSHQTFWKARLAALSAQIVYWSLPENRIEKMVEVVQLYFDGL